MHEVYQLKNRNNISVKNFLNLNKRSLEELSNEIFKIVDFTDLKNDFI